MSTFDKTARVLDLIGVDAAQGLTAEETEELERLNYEIAVGNGSATYDQKIFIGSMLGDLGCNLCDYSTKQDFDDLTFAEASDLIDEIKIDLYIERRQGNL